MENNKTNTSTDYLYTVRMEAGEPVETTHSEACFDVTGYTNREFADDPFLWINMVIEEDRDLVLQQITNIYSKRFPRPVEHRIVRKDGEVRWVESIVLPHQDEDGNLTSYDGVVRDITEHKKSANELRESEERFRLAASIVADLVYDFDVENETMRVFGDIDSSAGFTQDNLPTTLKDWLESIHPDDIRSVMDTYMGCFKTGQKAHFDYRVLGQDGTYRYWEEHVTPIFSQKGKLEKWVGAITDITRRKMTEIELQNKISKLENNNGHNTLPS